MFFLKNKQRTVGIIILILCYTYIASRLVQFQNWQECKNLVSSSPLFVTKILLAQLCLAFINLFVESAKWQLLISTIHDVKIWQSFKMVLAGFSSGIFTPGKIGEPIGRLISLPREYWAKGVVLNYFGGLIHNLVIFLAGLSCAAILWAQTNYHPYQKVMLYAISLITFLGLMSFSIWYFRDHFKTIIKHFRVLHKLTDTLSVLQSVSIPKGIWVFILSLVRFCIYSAQLFILFRTFGSETISTSFVLMIPIYFMAISLIPSFFLADIGVRSSVALLLFSKTSISEPIILLAVFLIWIINQVIPAFVGSLLFYKNKKESAAMQ